MRLLKLLPSAVAIVLAAPLAFSVFAAPVQIDLSHRLDEERGERLEKFVARFNERQKDYQLNVVRRVDGDAPKHLNLVTREEQAQFHGRARPTSSRLYQVMKQAKAALRRPQAVARTARRPRRQEGQSVCPAGGLVHAGSLHQQGSLPQGRAGSREAAEDLGGGAEGRRQALRFGQYLSVHHLLAGLGAYRQSERLERRRSLDAKGKLDFNGLVQVKHTAMLTTWSKARFFTYFGRRDEADRRFAAGECGMLTSTSSLFGTLRDGRKVETGVSALPYHDDVQGTPQQTLADGASLWVGGGKKADEYKGVALFVSFLMEPDLQVELTALEGFLPMTSVARAAANSQLLRADVASLDVAYLQLQGKGALA
jgi:sn-glycerol 3-phosphate transport system substrate-binding protein